MDAKKLLLNIRHTLKSLTSDARYTVTTVLALSVSFSIFLFMYGQVHVQSARPLTLVDGERFVLMNRSEFGRNILGGISNFERHYFVNSQKVLDDFGFYEERTSTTIATDQFSEQVRAAAVDSNLFRLTKVDPILGRTLHADDDISAGSAVISYRIWQRIFNADDQIIGQLVLIDGKPTKVVGVMPEGYQYPTNHDLWLSYVPKLLEYPNGEGWLTGFGRLKHGVTLEQARDSLLSLSLNLSKQFPKELDGKSIHLKLHHTIFNEHRAIQLTIMAVTALAILFMGILSGYSLIFVKLLHNKKTYAIQKALGVPRLAIVRQPILEVIFISLLAVGTSVGITKLLIDFSAGYLFVGIPFWWNLQVDIAMIAFAALAGGGVIVLSALAANVVIGGEMDGSEILGGSKGAGGATNSPWINHLITIKLMFAFAIVVFTGLSIFSFVKSLNIDYGVGESNMLIANVKLPEELSMQDRLEYFERLTQEIAAIEGVESFTYGRAMPGGWGFVGNVSTPGAGSSGVGNETTKIHDVVVAENYIDALDVELISGRAFLESDNEGAERVAIVPVSLAKSLFGSGEVVGRQLHLNSDAGGPVVTIVGVVQDLKFGNAATGWYALPGVLRPVRQHYPQWSYMEILVKVDGDPVGHIANVRNVARQIDFRVPLSDLETFSSRLSKHGHSYRNLVLNFIPAGVVALIMIALGVYAVSERAMQGRAREIGIMRAVGLPRRVIYWRFLKQNIVQYVFGSLLGVVAVSVFIFSIGDEILLVDQATVLYVMLLTLLLMLVVFVLANIIPIGRALKASIIDILKHGCI